MEGRRDGERALLWRLVAANLSLVDVLRLADVSRLHRFAILSSELAVWGKIKIISFEHAAISVYTRKANETEMKKMEVIRFPSDGAADRFFARLLDAVEVAPNIPIRLVIVDDPLPPIFPRLREVLAGSTRAHGCKNFGHECIKLKEQVQWLLRLLSTRNHLIGSDSIFQPRGTLMYLWCQKT